MTCSEYSSLATSVERAFRDFLQSPLRCTTAQVDRQSDVCSAVLHSSSGLVHKSTRSLIVAVVYYTGYRTQRGWCVAAYGALAAPSVSATLVLPCQHLPHQYLPRRRRPRQGRIPQQMLRGNLWRPLQPPWTRPGAAAITVQSDLIIWVWSVVREGIH